MHVGRGNAYAWCMSSSGAPCCVALYARACYTCMTQPISHCLQIPRLYNIYKETGVIDNFQQMLDNLFEPLFEVTQDPASHPQLHVFLGQVSRPAGCRPEVEKV